MPIISVTFEVPDTLPAEQVQALIRQVNAFAVANVQNAVMPVENDSAIPAPWDMDDAAFSAPDTNGQYSPLVFAGAGKGRPGVVGDDVEQYLHNLRSEWDERDER